eukprot:5224176-Amphidinium_carterae.1
MPGTAMNPLAGQLPEEALTTHTRGMRIVSLREVFAQCLKATDAVSFSNVAASWHQLVGFVCACLCQCDALSSPDSNCHLQAIAAGLLSPGGVALPCASAVADEPPYQEAAP